MPRFIEGQDRQQVTLLPECLDDFVAEDSTERIVDIFIGELDLVTFEGASPASTGRTSYHPSAMLKLNRPGAIHFSIGLSRIIFH
jgi:transposase